MRRSAISTIAVVTLLASSLCAIGQAAPPKAHPKSMKARGVNTLLEMMIYTGNRIEGLTRNKPWTTTNGFWLNARFALGRITKALDVMPLGKGRLVMTRRGPALAKQTLDGKSWQLLPVRKDALEQMMQGTEQGRFDQAALDLLMMSPAKLKTRTLSITKHPPFFSTMPN